MLISITEISIITVPFSKCPSFSLAVKLFINILIVPGSSFATLVLTFDPMERRMIPVFRFTTANAPLQTGFIDYTQSSVPPLFYPDRS